MDELLNEILTEEMEAKLLAWRDEMLPFHDSEIVRVPLRAVDTEIRPERLPLLKKIEVELSDMIERLEASGEPVDIYFHTNEVNVSVGWIDLIVTGNQALH